MTHIRLASKQALRQAVRWSLISRRRRSIGLLGSALLCAAVPALAQEQRPTQSTAAQSNSTSDIAALETIIVTVRRRAESLTEVPASITAYSSDFLAKQNIQSFDDYATKIPNLTFQHGNSSTNEGRGGFTGGRNTIIRGVSGDNTTAYYIDDVPVPSSVSPSVLNLDRIEVLKGPQGTLFGASSMGGNLRFITRQPDLSGNSYAVQVQGGQTKDAGFDSDVNARANIVLSQDRLALLAAARYSQDSGIITRRFPGPSGERISKDDEGAQDLYALELALRMKLTENLEASLKAFGQKSELDGYPGPYVSVRTFYRPQTYTNDRLRDVREYSHDEWGLAALTLSYDGPGFNVVSSTSYFDRRIEEREDTTEGTTWYLRTTYGTDLGTPPFVNLTYKDRDRFNHETRLSFDKGAILPNLSGIVGVFYQKDHTVFYQPGQFVPALAQSGLYAGGYIRDARTPASESNTAIFGELYYEIVPDLTLTLGARKYWIEQRTESYTTTGLVRPNGTTFPALETSQSGIVPKAVVSYGIGNDGNVYVSASRGFRVGGAQERLLPRCEADLAAIGLTLDDSASYDSDKLWSYEVGAKSTFNDGRLAVSSAAFQLDWEGIQQSTRLACGYPLTTNAGKARIRGGEFEVSGRPFASNSLTVQLGIGYTDGVLLDPGVTPREPNSRLVNVPRWSFALASYYRTPITSGSDLFMAADYSYTGGMKIDEGDGFLIDRQSFNMVNANIGIAFGNSQILLYGKNLLDRRLNLGNIGTNGWDRQDLLADGSYERFYRAAVTRPRQLGIQYRHEF